METAPKVMVIPPTAGRLAPVAASAAVRKKVAAYARVSTSHEEQQTSYEAQVDYYTRHIKSNPAWDFVEVYSDEGHIETMPYELMLKTLDHIEIGPDGNPEVIFLDGTSIKVEK